MAKQFEQNDAGSANDNTGWDVDPVHSQGGEGEGHSAESIAQGDKGAEEGQSAESIAQSNKGAEEGQGAESIAQGDKGAEEEQSAENIAQGDKGAAGAGDEGQPTIESLQAEVNRISTLANFFQTKYNEMMSIRVPGAAAPGAAAADNKAAAGATEGGFVPKVLDPAQMPQGIKGPPRQVRDNDGNVREEGGWDNQQEMSQYFDYRAGDIAADLMEEAHSKTYMPMFKNMERTIMTLQEHIMKIQHPDYDEVSKEVWGNIFTTDPQGKILGIKDPATLEFIRSQPFPQLAAYELGIQKRAPQKIKEAVKDNTKKVIKELTTKPKGPTKVEASGPAPEEGDLDWNTPADEAEKFLFKKGIIR